MQNQSPSNGFPDLSTAEAGAELNPGIQEMLQFIFSRKRSRRVGTKQHAINGDIVNDAVEDYLKKRPNIGSSDLKEVFKSPLSFYFAMNHQEEKKSTKAFELGSFVHRAFLEPEMFDNLVVEPDASLAELKGVTSLIDFWTGKLVSSRPDATIIFAGAAAHVEGLKLDIEGIKGKKEYLRYLKEKSGMECISEDNKLIVDLIKKQYYSYGGGIIPEILKHAEKECSFYTTDPDTGLPVKVRPDAFQTKENIGVDAIISFKTTSAATLDKFIYDTAKFKYEITEGMYQEVVSHVTGRNFNVTIMIMLQTVPPFSPAVFWWTPEDIANGKYKYHHALSTVKDCYDKGIFAGFDVFAEEGHYGIMELKQPEWAQKIIAPVDVEL